MEYYPDCFDSLKQYEAWCELALEDPELIEPRLSFCNDCTIKYQTKMKLTGRCMFPDKIIEVEVDDGRN